MADVEKVIEFLEDDKNYLFKMAENPNYSDADRRKADDLYCDIKEAIQTIRELQEQNEALWRAKEELTKFDNFCKSRNLEESEEVCEWTLVSVVNVFNEKMYRTCTDRLSEKNDEYKYCPYCGKKIKVVK